MKRERDLFKKIISDENIYKAIDSVNKSHRWVAMNKPNKKVLWVEYTKKERVKEIRQIILDGFIPHETKHKKRYDKNAKKWRDIEEPLLYPDQYIHHALIQVLEPVMMRGMDRFCCGSIKERGAIYGKKAIEKWIRKDKSGTNWCAELDIYHFYEQLSPEVVLDRMKQLIKDHQTLDLIERVLLNNLSIGAYFSQWFANTVLQPLDHLIREGGFGVKHYERYIDNLLIFSNRKRSIQKTINAIEFWLSKHNLRLNNHKQLFKVSKRMPNALGYRYGRNYTLIRKHALLNLKRQISSYEKKKKAGKFIPVKMAYSLLSRIGRLKHCNCYNIRKKYIRKGLLKELKNIIRNYQRRERKEWNIVLEQYINIMNFSKLLEQNLRLERKEILKVLKQLNVNLTIVL